LLILTLAAAGPAPAQAPVRPAEPAAPDTTLPEISVTAARVPVPTRDAPARVTVLDREAMAATGAVTVADLLGDYAPLFVRHYGPSGLATVTLRGAGSAQTLLLLDGQRLADPQLGPLDLTLLPTVLLESAEVLHGGGSALYGTDAVGGVVHLRSLRPEGPGRMGAVVEAGAWGQQRAAVTAGGSVGRLSVVGAAEAETADEDFRYADPTRLDGARIRHTGWDRRRAVGYAALGYAAGPTRLRLAVLAADSERGLGGTDSVGARQWDRLGRAWADASRRTAWGRVEASGYVQAGRLRYASPYPSTRPDALDETGSTTTTGGDLRLHYTRPQGWHGTVSLTAGEGRATHPSLADDATDRHAALAVTAVQTAGRIRLFPAVRLDAYAPAGGDRRLAFSPQLGLNAQPFTTSSVRLKASVGRTFRMPTLNDRFWRPGGVPDLRPERGWTADAGLVWSTGRYRAEGTLFAAGTRDQIVWRPGAGAVWSPENVGRTRALGVEATGEGAWVLGPALATARLAATLTDARDRSDPSAPAFDQPLRYVPRWTTTARAALTWRMLRLDLGMHAVGRRYTTSDASRWLDPHVVFDGQLRASHAFPHVEATLAVVVENLTDGLYEGVASYVMPPRHARVRLLLRSR
ncbi:MAG: TonB-dependent receptor, partial [Rhodothermales bacterium]|nr:TonB-dependent receptor [Rhodothermales bacterium]